MRTTLISAVVLSAIAVGTASPQSFPAGLTKYLSLNDAQVQAISDINTQFAAYGQTQAQAYDQLNGQASDELAKDNPDPSAVGTPYAKMEMIRRDYVAQTAQVQSKIAALLHPDQLLLVIGLLQAERLQELAWDAGCLLSSGDSNSSATTTSTNAGLTGTPCGGPGAVLINYLHLTSSQVIAMNNAIQVFQDYETRLYFQREDLSFQIADLTAATPIDPIQLGAAYIAQQKLYRDEDAQALQLVKTFQNLITDEQQALLQPLRDAQKILPVAQAAVCFNILVLPQDLQNYYYGPGAFPNNGYCYYDNTSSDATPSAAPMRSARKNP